MALNVQLMPVTSFRQNCTLIWDDESLEAVLCDVGGDVPMILDEVKKLGLTVKAIWLTHGHLDHCGGVVEFLEHMTVPVFGPHRDDDFLLQSLPEITASYGFPISPSFEPSQWLDEGQTLNFGVHRFHVFHIPGHTPGHLVFYCAEQKLLIAGDVLFYESVGRTDFPRSSTEALLHGIRHKLYSLPDDVVVIAGHGRTTTIGHEKQYNPFINLNQPSE